MLDAHDDLSPLAAVTANNLACLYRRKGQLDKALHQLRRAAKIEGMCASPRGPADTQINLCVVLSEQGRHDEAAGHASHALRLVQERRSRGPNPPHPMSTRAARFTLPSLLTPRRPSDTRLSRTAAAR
jgi:tetratricopeptide (TPR) repeat protein